MGKYKGAIVLLEKYLEHSLLWFPCRRHSCEVHITHGMEIITGSKTKGPRRGVYRSLEKVWPDVHIIVKKCENFALFHWKKHRGTKFGQMAEESRQFCSRLLSTGTVILGDYKN